MKRTLVNRQSTTRKLLQLFLLCAVLLAPKGAWADSYNLWVGDTQVTDDNKDDVLGNNSGVSFSVSSETPALAYTLTLNKANIGVIKTSLSNLDVELIGANTISGGNEPVFQSLGGNVDVTITIQSTTSGVLTMNMANTEAGTFYGDNVELVIQDPLTVLSGSLTSNDGNDNTAIIGEQYGVTVGGIVVNALNYENVLGDQQESHAVTYAPDTHTLTLNNAIVGSNNTGASISTYLDDLTITLVGSNILNGNIQYSESQSTGPVELSFFGDNGCSLEINSNSAITGFMSVNANGFYLKSDKPLRYIDKSYNVSNMTITKAEVCYPIWVYTGADQEQPYKQLTAEDPSVTWASDAANGTVSCSYENQKLKLILNNAQKSIGDNYAFIFGEDVSTMDVMLVGENKLTTGNGFEFYLSEEKKSPVLSFETSENGTGSFTVSGNYAFAESINDEDVIIECQNGLVYDSGNKSVLPLYLTIGDINVTGTNENILSENEPHLSFDADNLTLTLNGATLGATAEQNITVYTSSLSVKIKGANTMNGGFISSNGIARNLSFITDVAAASLTMTTPIPEVFTVACSNDLNLNEARTEVTLSMDNGTYDLWIGGNQVTSDNRTAIPGSTTGTISFSPESNTLTLNGVTSESYIKSGLSSLIINLVGTNTIDIAGNSAVLESTNSNAPLTITKEGSSASLTISNHYASGQQYPVIFGFTSVSYPELSLISSVPTTYVYVENGNIQGKGLNYLYKGYALPPSSVTFSTETAYQLWIAGYQVTESNKNNVTERDVPQVTYTPASDNNPARLSLLSATIEGKIYSKDDLEVYFVGQNTITAPDTAAIIRSIDNTSMLYLTNANNTSSLVLSNEISGSQSVIHSFTSIELANGLYQETRQPVNYDATPNKGFVDKVSEFPVPYLKYSTTSNYPLWVGGVQVTSENASNIGAKNIKEVSFDAANNILTLYRSNISMEGTAGFPVVSSIANLIVKLIDSNNITLYDDDAYQSFAKYVGESGADPKLTFETEGYMDDGIYWLGDLTINNLTTIDDVADGYTITNVIDVSTEDIIPEGADDLTTGWKVSYGSTNSYVKIWKLEVFDLWIGSGRVLSTDVRAGIQNESGPLYNPVTQSLQFAGKYNYPVKSSMGQLNIAVYEDCGIINDSQNPFDGFAISFRPTDNHPTGSLNFVLPEYANNNEVNKFTIDCSTGAISGFSNVTYEAPLKLITPATAPAIWDENTTQLVVSNFATYDLSILNTTNEEIVITTNNCTNVLNDENKTVIYNPSTNTLTLDNANIKGVNVGFSPLTINLIGANTIDGNFTYNGQGKCDLFFITDATSATSLTMTNTIGAESFNVEYRNNLKLDNTGLVISLIDNYGITISYNDGTDKTVDVTPTNRLNVLYALNTNGESTVWFNGKNQLVLDGATNLMGITVNTTNALNDNELEVFLIGNNTITNTTGNAITYGGTTSGKLTFVTDGNTAGTLVYTNSSAPTIETAFNNFTVEYGNGLTPKINNNTLTIAESMPMTVDHEGDKKETDYSTLDPSESTNNVIKNGFLYTTGDKAGESDKTSGLLTIDGKTRFVFPESSAKTLAEVEGITADPCSPEYAETFPGVTARIPAGGVTVETSAWADANHAVMMKVAGQAPINISNPGSTDFLNATHRIQIAEPSTLQIYLQPVGLSSAPRMSNHRIGPKSSVAGALGGVKVTSNSIQTSTPPALTYKLMEKSQIFSDIISIGDVLDGYTCNDPDISDLPDDMFVDNSPSPAPRRAGAVEKILHGGLTFVDFSETKITGMEVSRTKGAFNKVPDNVFIYMPAGNSVAKGTKNVVIGGICDVMELEGEVEYVKPFKAKKNFKAGQATLKRTFEAYDKNNENAPKTATIYLPYAISQDDADKLGDFYKYKSIDGSTVKMTKVDAGGLKANMPYIFKAKAGGVENPMVRSTDVTANPSVTDGFKGVYARKDYEAGMYCYAAEGNVGQFVEMGTGSYVPPFRAYMIGNGAPSYAILWDGVLENMEEEPNMTAVETVKTAQDKKAAEGWWTLNGIRLNGQPQKPGMYIVDGRLVVVK